MGEFRETNLPTNLAVIRRKVLDIFEKSRNSNLPKASVSAGRRKIKDYFLNDEIVKGTKKVVIDTALEALKLYPGEKFNINFQVLAGIAFVERGKRLDESTKQKLHKDIQTFLTNNRIAKNIDIHSADIMFAAAKTTFPKNVFNAKQNKRWNTVIKQVAGNPEPDDKSKAYRSILSNSRYMARKMDIEVDKTTDVKKRKRSRY